MGVGFSLRIRQEINVCVIMFVIAAKSRLRRETKKVLLDSDSIKQTIWIGVGEACYKSRIILAM
jgi:hypothetical protein